MFVYIGTEKPHGKIGQLMPVHKRVQSCVYKCSTKAFLLSLVNKPGHMDRHYNKSINPFITTVVPHLVLDMIFTAMLQPAKTPTQVLDGATSYHSLLSALVASPSLSRQELSIFNLLKLKYSTKIFKGK